MGGRGKSSGVQHQLSIQDQLLRTEVASIIMSRGIEIEADRNDGSSQRSSVVLGGTHTCSDNRSCACCGTYSIPYNSEQFTCPICGWVDDIYQNSYPDSTIGPNVCSLNQMKDKIRNIAEEG
ncbi:MAG: CPCC family cysteine-rich protein [Lachnospiraceae bacterium]